MLVNKMKVQKAICDREETKVIAYSLVEKSPFAAIFAFEIKHTKIAHKMVLYLYKLDRY